MKAKLTFIVLIILCLYTAPLSAARVACVGDSITYGAGISNREKNAYPAQLGQILSEFDSTWEARNFGVNSATLLRKGDLPYWQLTAFTQARQWLPDIVIIMLGTNDSKPVNWAHKADFVSDYTDMIDASSRHPGV